MRQQSTLCVLRQNLLCAHFTRAQVCSLRTANAYKLGDSAECNVPLFQNYLIIRVVPKKKKSAGTCILAIWIPDDIVHSLFWLVQFLQQSVYISDWKFWRFSIVRNSILGQNFFLVNFCARIPLFSNYRSILDQIFGQNHIFSQISDEIYFFVRIKYRPNVWTKLHFGKISGHFPRLIQI